MKKDLRELNENCQKKVLILGAGYVTPPVVDYLSSQGEILRVWGSFENSFLGHQVSLVSAIEGEADQLISKHGFQNCTGHVFDCVNDTGIGWKGLFIRLTLFEYRKNSGFRLW